MSSLIKSYTVTDTVKDEPTVVILPTETPGLTEVSTETSESFEEIFTATPLSSTPTVSATATPTLIDEVKSEEKPSFEIVLKSDPEFITSGGNFNLHWQINPKDLEGLDLVFTLPYGVTLLTEKKQLRCIIRS